MADLAEFGSVPAEYDGQVDFTEPLDLEDLRRNLGEWEGLPYVCKICGIVWDRVAGHEEHVQAHLTPGSGIRAQYAREHPTVTRLRKRLALREVRRAKEEGQTDWQSDIVSSRVQRELNRLGLLRRGLFLPSPEIQDSLELFRGRAEMAMDVFYHEALQERMERHDYLPETAARQQIVSELQRLLPRKLKELRAQHPEEARRQAEVARLMRAREPGYVARFPLESVLRWFSHEPFHACPFCWAYLDIVPDNVIKHLRTHFPPIYRCNICLAGFEKHTELDYHAYDEHDVLHRLCPLCSGSEFDNTDHEEPLIEVEEHLEHLPAECPHCQERRERTEVNEMKKAADDEHMMEYHPGKRPAEGILFDVAAQQAGSRSAQAAPGGGPRAPEDPPHPAGRGAPAEVLELAAPARPPRDRCCACASPTEPWWRCGGCGARFCAECAGLDPCRRALGVCCACLYALRPLLSPGRRGAPLGVAARPGCRPFLALAGPADLPAGAVLAERAAVALCPDAQGLPLRLLPSRAVDAARGPRFLADLRALGTLSFSAPAPELHLAFSAEGPWNCWMEALPLRLPGPCRVPFCAVVLRASRPLRCPAGAAAPLRCPLPAPWLPPAPAALLGALGVTKEFPSRALRHALEAQRRGMRAPPPPPPEGAPEPSVFARFLEPAAGWGDAEWDRWLRGAA